MKIKLTAFLLSMSLIAGCGSKDQTDANGTKSITLVACRACKWRIRMIVQKVRRFRVQLEHFDHCSPLNGKFLL